MITEQNITNEVNKIIHLLKVKGEKMDDIMSDIAFIISEAFSLNWDEGGRWDGDENNISIFSGGNEKWQALSEGYKNKLLNNKEKTEKWTEAVPTLRRHSGGLYDSWEVYPQGHSIIAVARKPYAAAHQFGVKFMHPGGTPYISNGKGVYFLKKENVSKYGDRVKYTRPHEIIIPPRPYFVLSEEDLQNIINYLAQFFLSK